MKNQALITLYKTNYSAIPTNLEGVSDVESLKTSGNGENNINWILGHIVSSRDTIHEKMGLPLICNNTIKKTYGRGSSSTNTENAISLAEMLKTLESSQEMILAAIPEIDDVDVIKRIAFYGFHEAYHVGQLGLMRKIIGKKGAIA